jgi:septal ring factor EnvC (AmiA/AmiB activator)
MTKLKARSLLALPLIGLFCLSLSLYGLADNHQEAELKQLKRSISALEKKLDQQRQEKGALQTQIEAVELDSAKLNQTIRNLSHKITAATEQLKALQDKKNRLDQRIEQQRSAIAEQIRYVYKTGNEEPIKLLLNQQDPQQLARTLKYYDYILQARSEKIEQFTDDITQLEAIATEIETTKIGLTKSKVTLEKQRKKHATNVKSRKTMLDELNQSLLLGNKQLTGYQKQHKQLEKLLSSVKKAAQKVAPAKNYPAFASRKGKLKWPARGKLKNTFGAVREGDLRWQGWLISTPSGTDISAVHHGRVVFSNYMRGFGLLVIIDHGNSFMSLYAHNQELMRETGDWVQSGDIVAQAGNTGGLINPALYFEIREKGLPVNPKIWLGNR